MEIRPAAAADIPEVQSIYAHHVLTGTGTFEEAPPSLEEMQARFRKVAAGHRVWLVAADASGVLGFGYYAPFRDRSAYRYCVEDSIYVREDILVHGVGKSRVSQLIDAAAQRGIS